MKKGHSFGKPERIKRNSEYRRAREQGTFYRDGVFILTILKNNKKCHRLGLAISSSKVRLSSKRNRIKRLLREAFRLSKANFKNGPYDIVISIAKPPLPNMNYPIVEKRLRMLLKRAGIL